MVSQRRGKNIEREREKEGDLMDKGDLACKRSSRGDGDGQGHTVQGGPDGGVGSTCYYSIYLPSLAFMPLY